MTASSRSEVSHQLLDLNDVETKPIRYDVDEIVRRLRETAEQWVPRHFPGGRREGDDWRLANIQGATPRKHGSCTIALKGERAGDWFDHDTRDGGGPLCALEKATGLTGRELLVYAAREVGWSPAAPQRQAPSPQPRRKDHRREIDFILSRAGPLSGTPAETYLCSRGLALPDCPDLLFHPDLTHWETKMGMPGLVGVVRGPSGEVTALHRTYLRDDATGKADVPKAKKMLGPVAGGAVQLGSIGADGRLGLAEGIETALAVMTACLDLPVWAALSAGHLEQVHLPPEAKTIIILADNDSSEAGLRAAETAARRFRAEGRSTAIVMPPDPDSDFNDLLLDEGTEAVARLIQNAPLQNAETQGDEPALGRHLPLAFTRPLPPLPARRADEGDLTRACDGAWVLLLEANRTPWLFRAGGLPSWIVPDDRGRARAETLSEDRLRYMLARLASWRRKSRTGEMVPAAPPMGLVKAVLATPDPALPVLEGIVNTPVLGRSGTLITTPGYHPDARLFYQPLPGFRLPEVPERPTADDIATARTLIVDELLGDFPFTGEPERAHAVSLLLLGFVRALIDGPTPLHVIEKPEVGTGAGLLVDLITMITAGSHAAVMAEGRDDDEWRKRLTAKLRDMPAMLLIDNINRTVDSGALAAALTANIWEDRILGQSQIIRVPIRCVWMATGNNPRFSREIMRRLLRIRLDAKVERPYQRTGFRHPDIMGWARANRARLVAACLTLCRAWVAAGRPQGTKTIGSFEAWARTMGGILEVAGIEGFLGNLDEVIERSDPEGAAWHGFIAAWWERFGTAEVGTGDLHEVAAACELPLGSGNERSQRTRLGKALGRMRDRVFSIDEYNLRIEVSGTFRRAQKWRISVDERGERVNVAAPCERSTGNVHTNVHTANTLNQQGNSGSCERCERFSDPYARTRTRTQEEREKRSQRSQRSQSHGNSMSCECERGGERRSERSHLENPPDWLKEVL